MESYLINNPTIALFHEDGRYVARTIPVEPSSRLTALLSIVVMGW
jgi:hypothetical protein